MHQGDADGALAMLEHIGDDDVMPHPFALPHRHYTRCLAHGHMGHVGAAADALTALDRAVERLGPPGRRFQPVAHNVRSWLLRSTGQDELADEASVAALELSRATSFEEPLAHARLDLAEGRLRASDVAEAAAIVDDVGATLNDDSTMAWHVRQRVWWLSGRLALEAADPDRAGQMASTLIADAAGRGSARYGVLGDHLAAIAAPRSLTPSRTAKILAGLDRHAGLDAWWLAAELAAAAGIVGGRAISEERAARLLASAGPDVDRAALARWFSRRLDVLGTAGRAVDR